MDKWRVLGIEKTKDKDAVREAYRNKVRGVNPEDDQAGFMRLRKAYEEALVEADQTDEEDEFDDSPVGRWMRDVDDVYSHFSRRLVKEEWEGLLANDVCIALDSRTDARDALLRYLMEHCHLPKEAWALIVDAFDVVENKGELYEDYPKDYIDYLIRSAKHEDVLSYRLYGEIDDEKDYDGFIDCFHNIHGANRNRDAEKVWEGLGEIAAFGVEHPYVELERAKCHLGLKEVEQAREILERLMKEYGEEEGVVHFMAEVEWVSADYGKALEYYNKVCAINPQHYYARLGVADCYRQMEQWGDARKIYLDLLDVNRYDAYVLSSLMTVNDAIIERRVGNPAEWRDDFEKRMELAWCYFQRERYEECLETMDVREPDGAEVMEQVYLKGRTYQCLSKKEEARAHFERWMELYRKYRDDEGEKAVKGREKLGMVYSCLGDVVEEDAEALQYIEDAIDAKDENTSSFYYQKAVMLKRMEERGKAYQTLEQAIEMDEMNYAAYLLRGEMYQEDEVYSEAVRDYENAISIYPYYEEPYARELGLLCESEAPEALERMRGVLERAEELGVRTPKLQMYRAKLLRREEKYEEAIALMKELLEGEEEIEGIDEFYYVLTTMYYDNKQYQEALDCIKKSIEMAPDVVRYRGIEGDAHSQLDHNMEAIASYETILRSNPQNETVLYRMGIVYRKMGRLDDAVDALERLVEIAPLHRNAHGLLGEVYEDREQYQEAKRHYLKQLELNPSVYYDVSMGLICYMEGDFDEAVAYFAQGKEREPDNPYSYFNEGRARMAKMENGRALECLQKAVELAGEDCPGNFYQYLYRCYARMEEWEKALAVCDRQIDKDVWTTWAIMRKCVALDKLGRSKETFRLLRNRASADAEEAPRLLRELAERYEESYGQYKKRKGNVLRRAMRSLFGSPTKAEYWYRTAIRRNMKDGTSHKLLATYYFEREAWHKALKGYMTALKCGCGGAEKVYWYMACCVDKIWVQTGARAVYLRLMAVLFYNLRGGAHLVEEYVKKGLEACDANEKDKSQVTSVCCTRARLYLLVGEVESARKACEDVLGRRYCICDFCNSSDCHEAHYLMGCVHEAEGRPKEALGFYKKALAIAPDDWEYIKACERSIGDDYRD